jgi:hypothetical protein
MDELFPDLPEIKKGMPGIYKDRPYNHEIIKESTIYTPDWMSNQIYDILNQSGNLKNRILDPCIGKGSLIKPYLEDPKFQLFGIDSNPQIQEYSNLEIIKSDFLTFNSQYLKPDLILCNPPLGMDLKPSFSLLLF